MKQEIVIARNKNIYSSRDALIASLNDSVVHAIGMPLLHIYNKDDGTKAAMLTIGIGNGQGADKYQIVVNEVDLAVLSTYTNKTPMWIDLGGMKIGDTFDALTYNEMFTKLLYPYLAPTISFSVSPSGRIFENGSQAGPFTLSVNITKKAQNIQRVQFFNNSEVIHTVLSPKPGGGMESCVTDVITSNASFNVKVYDGTTDLASSTIAIKFVYPYYVGKVTKDVIVPTGDAIKKLTKTIKQPENVSVTYTFNDEKLVFAVPPGWTISSIKDPSGYEIIDSFRKDTVSVTGLDGKAVSYTVYTMIESVGLEDFKISFNR